MKHRRQARLLFFFFLFLPNSSLSFSFSQNAQCFPSLAAKYTDPPVRLGPQSTRPPVAEDVSRRLNSSGQWISLFRGKRSQLFRSASQSNTSHCFWLLNRRNENRVGFTDIPYGALGFSTDDFKKEDYLCQPAGSIDLTRRSVTSFRTMDTCPMQINSCNTNHIPYVSFLILVLTQEQHE